MDQINHVFSNGHQYILVAIDNFSKSVEAVPVRKVDQVDVVNFIKDNIVCRFGIPQTLTTDKGTMFIVAKMQKYVESYYAQANGQVEAANKILTDLISKHTKQKSKSWHETLT